VADAGVLVAAGALERAGRPDGREPVEQRVENEADLGLGQRAARQKCDPCPNARWELGSRRMSNVNGSANTASSWLAEAHHSVTLSPAAMRWPPSTVSTEAVGRLYGVVDSHRRISSAAPARHSTYVLTTQNPSPAGVCGVGGWNDTGASRRRWAKTSWGKPSTNRSRSVRSMSSRRIGRVTRVSQPDGRAHPRATAAAR
jgi:hypothetical protein